MQTFKHGSTLVTGGAGFIGSHVVDRLLQEGQKVTVIDNFDPFYERKTKEANIARHRDNPDFRFLEVDIRNSDNLRECLDGIYFDSIVHLAAKAGVRPSIRNPLEYQEVNVKGTQNLLELAREKNIKQFVFASSSSVYGINPNVPWREDDYVLMPISPYASTKVSGELLGHVYSHLYGIRFLALRFFTVYGPRQRPDLAIHKFARNMLQGKPITLYGDGSSRRDYTYIADVVDGIISAMEYKKSSYEVINIGNNRTIALSEMVKILEDLLGIHATIKRKPEQPGDVPQTWASLEKAKIFLGYNPKVEFKSGVKNFAEWLTQDTV